MNSIFKKAKLGVKIGAGFAVVIALLIITSVVSWNGLNYAKNGFSDYRTLARDTNLAGRLQANMLMIRMNVKDFIITESDKDKEEYADYHGKMKEFLDESHREIQEANRARILADYSDNVQKYDEAFRRVIGLFEQRDDLVKQHLYVIGPKMERDLTSIMESAKADGDTDATYQAGICLRNMLLGRLYVQKFIVDHNIEAYDRAKDEFQKLDKGLGILNSILENPERRALMADVVEKSKTYLDIFERTTKTINEHNLTIRDTLDALGPVMAKQVEDVKLDLKAEQDQLGPKVQQKVFRANTIGLSISAAALLISIFAATLLTKMITGPVRKVNAYVEQLAGGDFTAEIDFRSGDEIGHMVESLAAMGASLREGFHTIQEGVSNMASSTTELSAISTQLESNADKSHQVSNSVASASEETSQSMAAVAASVEQMSSNLRSVATASEEMSSTIEEIAKNTEQGRNITQTAVSKVDATAQRMNQLGKAADLIGNITETIKGISDQTNLLALNATIEAASAGDAGKGFAVVANEIKELSRQTAQATEQISSSIENIQNSTKLSIDEIAGIVEIISEIDQITNLIATAVEEQSNTTAEIAHNVSETSDGVQEVARNVAQVNSVSGDIARDVSEVNNSATEIASASAQLNASVGELSEFAEKLNEIASRYKV